MTNIISFSGGKDSTALILWAKENLKTFQTIFCDTGWEDKTTYDYIDYINRTLLDKKLITLRSEKYDGFADLCIKKKRIPSVKTRYCTTELKKFPTQKYISQLEDVNLYVGIRADESPARSEMKLKEYDFDYYECWVHRPLLKWTAKEVFEIHKKYKIDPNPLYKLGSKRVGCMPCIMSNHSEMKQLIKNRPDVINKVRRLEEKTGTSFFPPRYIPKWACTGVSKNGAKFPTVDDVVKYLKRDENQKEMFDSPTCISFNGLCE